MVDARVPGADAVPGGPAEPDREVQAGAGRWDSMASALDSVARAFCLLGYATTACLLVRYHSAPRWDVFLVPTVLVVGSLLTWLLRWPYRARVAIWTATIVVTLALAAVLIRSPLTALACAPVCFAASILLGPVGALGFAGYGTLLTILGARLSVAPAVDPAPLASLWLAAILGATSAGRLYLALQRSEASAEIAWEEAREARVRRGDLYRVVRSLEEATFRIERLNHELNQARMEAEMARTQKSRFVATVSHEIRGPLNLILGFSRLMVLSPEHYAVPLPPAYRADLDAIYRNSEHLAGLIDDVIDLAQIDADRLPLMKDWTDLESEVLREAVDIVRPLAERKGLSVTLEVSGSLPRLMADAIRLRQVVLNLLINAVRYSDRGRIALSAARTGDVVEVSVRDTGRGIEPDDIPRLFREFSEVSRAGGLTGERGSGLGLSICKYLIELHGGEIRVESVPDQGTTMRFTIPLDLATTGHDPAVRRPATQGGEPENVLVIYEDALIVRALARYIDGYRIAGITNVEGARDLIMTLQPRAVIASPHDCEAIREIMASTLPDLPLIATAFQRPEGVGGDLGLAGYLVKPVSAELLLGVVNRLTHDGENQILLVEDDLDAMRLVERMLTSLPRPYHIRKAYDGLQALAMMQTIMPDVVLMDLAMPNLDGQETVAQMRADERLRAVPVVAISARDWDEGGVTMRAPLSLWREEPLDAARGVRCLKAMLDALGPSVEAS